MEHTKRDPLIGNFFIVRGEDGAPVKAGRIRSRTLDGEYNVTIYGDAAPRGELATSAQMATDRWELYINESNWRRAFARCQQEQPAGPVGAAHETEEHA